MLFDLEVTERYSIDAVDVIYDGEPAYPSLLTLIITAMNTTGTTMLNLKIEKGIPLPKKGGFERTSELSQLTNLFHTNGRGRQHCNI